MYARFSEIPAVQFVGGAHDQITVFCQDLLAAAVYGSTALYKIQQFRMAVPMHHKPCRLSELTQMQGKAVLLIGNKLMLVFINITGNISTFGIKRTHISSMKAKLCLFEATAFLRVLFQKYIINIQENQYIRRKKGD